MSKLDTFWRAHVAQRLTCAAVQASSKQSGGLFVAQNGMSEGTFYAWEAKFGGMTVLDVKRLKALEDENAKLKKLLAERCWTRRR